MYDENLKHKGQSNMFCAVFKSLSLMEAVSGSVGSDTFDDDEGNDQKAVK